MKILIATHNQHKLNEFTSILSPLGFEVLGYNDIRLSVTEETGKTFDENCLLKARVAFQQTGFPTIADDSGLCIHALNNAPGIYTSRFAEEHGGFPKVFHKIWELLYDKADKTAHFHCSIAFVDTHIEKIFTGQVMGIISNQADDSLSHFGYDPIFIPNGYSKPFGAISENIKNQISHRGRALQKLLSFLETYRD